MIKRIDIVNKCEFKNEVDIRHAFRKLEDALNTVLHDMSSLQSFDRNITGEDVKNVDENVPVVEAKNGRLYIKSKGKLFYWSLTPAPAP